MSAATKLLSGQPFDRLTIFSRVPIVDVQRWSPANRILPEKTARILSINRVREHTKVSKKFAKISNELVTAKLPTSELNVLFAILLLHPWEYPTRRELRASARVGYKQLTVALDSLVRRNILFLDYLETADGEREIWHIASPWYWKIDGFRNASYESGATDPGKWIPRKLSTAPVDGRIDEYSESFASEYVTVPRDMKNLELSANARRIWVYLASLRLTWHPTTKQIAKAVKLSKPTVLRSLWLLEECRMVVFNDRRSPEFNTPLERTYHTVHPKFWSFENCSDLPGPKASVFHDPETINNFAHAKKRKQAPQGQIWKRHRVKSGNATGSNPVTPEGQIWKHHAVKSGNTQGQIQEQVAQPGLQSEGGFQGISGSYENIKKENMKKENERIENAFAPRSSVGKCVYQPNGKFSTDITHLVADNVDCAFLDRFGNKPKYPSRLNGWIAEFTLRNAAGLGCLDMAFDETEAFCTFIRDTFGGRRFFVQKGSFKQMEAAWEQHKAAAATAAAESTELQSSDTAAESQNPALECEKTAHPSCSTETAFQPPVLEILPSLPVVAEPVNQAAISSFEPLPEARVLTEEKKPKDLLPFDPERQQWLVARVYAKSSKWQRLALNKLWAEKPGQILSILRDFSRTGDGRNGPLVDSARAELDALGILRKADIPALPWLDSGEIAPVVTPAAAPKENPGDGTLPLNRDRLKNALRRLLNKKEPNPRLRFEIDAKFMAITDDAVFHAELCNKFGREAVEGVLDGNH